jgi:hypothetical protein
VIELWRQGGLGGGRPLPYGGMFGPSVVVAKDESDIHNALGTFMTNGLPMTILVVAPIVATRPFKVNDEGKVANPEGLSIVGLGQQRIYTAMRNAGERALFDFEVLTGLIVQGLSIGTQDGENLPDSVFYLSAVTDFELAGIKQATPTAPASTNWLNSNISPTDGLIVGCQSDLDLRLTGVRCRVVGNKLRDVILPGFITADNCVTGNNMRDGDDSTSRGGNSATGNTGGGSFAAWTGAGSVATGNA